MAITSPTGTMSPSLATSCRIVPDSNASSSTVALSVSISAMTSPRRTVSPTCFSQRTSVPSTMSAPIWGIVTSIVTAYSLNIPRTASTTSSSDGSA
jgi:hypothetical protein